MTSNIGKTKVVAIKHDDKFIALHQVIEQSDFFDVLEQKLEESRKDKKDFLIAIKPNIMMAYSKNDPSTITDPELVEYLIDEMVKKGYTNITIVESQNVFGNWFRNRDVVTVATYFGYSNNKNYQIVDLTEEKIPFNYGGKLGEHWIGSTWKEADFRISFAKNKTHISCYFTLTIKNLYGCMPLQNKFKEYHKKREFDWPTIEMIQHFPCHFGLIDAIWSADGIWGLKFDDKPNKTNTIIGGNNIIAVEWVGAKKMGLDPIQSRIFKLAHDTFDMPDIDWIGDQSVYDNWNNIPPLVDKAIDMGEEFYNPSNIVGFISSDMDPYFSPKITNRLLLLIRKMVIKILKFTSRIGL